MELGYYEHSRQEMLEFIPHSAHEILDIGCGTGEFLRSVKALMPDSIVWGIDIAPEAAEVARTKLDVVLCGDVMQVLHKVPDDRFDAIVLNDVLEHLSNPVGLLRSLRAKLRFEGVIVASIPNVRFVLNLRDLLFHKDWKYTPAGILDAAHLRFFTRKSMIRMIGDTGYRLTTIKGINPIKSFKFDLLNMACLGFLEDARYVQYAIVACRSDPYGGSD